MDRGRKREPVDLIVAKGKTHLSKEEIKRRREQEIKVPYTDVTAPDYLPEELVPEFDDIAQKLLDINIMTELDEDTLARYLLSKRQYLKLTYILDTAMNEMDIDTLSKYQTMQDKAFKQCRMGASDLGLSITSRAKLVVPVKEAPPKNKFLEKFGE